MLDRGALLGLDHVAHGQPKQSDDADAEGENDAHLHAGLPPRVPGAPGVGLADGARVNPHTAGGRLHTKSSFIISGRNRSLARTGNDRLPRPAACSRSSGGRAGVRCSRSRPHPSVRRVAIRPSPYRMTGGGLQMDCVDATRGSGSRPRRRSFHWKLFGGCIISSRKAGSCRPPTHPTRCWADLSP